MAGDVRRGAPARSVGVSLAVASLLLLAACAPADRPPPAAPAGRVTSAPRPTERDGDTDDTGSKAFADVSARQDALERFDAQVRAEPGAYAHGFIATVDDPATMSVTLLWFGTDPWRDRLVAAGARAGVHVSFQQRARSLAGFQAAQRRLVAAHARLAAMGFSTVSISGIGAEPEPLTMEGTFSKGADRAALERFATRIAGQPVRVEPGTAGF